MLAARFGWLPDALMNLEWDEVENWIDQAEWTAKAANGETVER